MQSLSLHETASRNAPVDLAQEIANLEALIIEERAELVRLQQSLREFKERYTQTVGSPLAELSEVERAIKEAEARLFDLETESEREGTDDSYAAEHVTSASARTGPWPGRTVRTPCSAAIACRRRSESR